jgi:hypothetical protein
MAGRFLAPSGEGNAEIVVVEGSQVLRNRAVNMGFRFLSGEKAKRMLVVVLHEFSKEDRLFAIQGKYSEFLIDESEKMGMERGRFQVIMTPINGHPITLTEAQFVVAKLSRDGIKSAILLSEGFHTRRSFGVYNQEGARVGLRIIPFPYFNEYKDDDWWHHADGVHDFFQESVKLAYYLMRGYVSIKYLRRMD